MFRLCWGGTTTANPKSINFTLRSFPINIFSSLTSLWTTHFLWQYQSASAIYLGIFFDLLLYSRKNDSWGLLNNDLRFVLREPLVRTGFHEIVKWEISHVFHDKVDLAGTLKHLEEFDNIGVSQFRQNFNLPLDVFQFHGILKVFLLVGFYGDFRSRWLMNSLSYNSVGAKTCRAIRRRVLKVFRRENEKKLFIIRMKLIFFFFLSFMAS